MTKIEKEIFNELIIKEKNTVTIEEYFWNDANQTLSINTTIETLLKKTNTLHVPFFQRTYKWKKDNIEELIDDVIEKNSDGYFIGQILIKRYLDETANQFLIIDGQQRLTTILLILYWFYSTYGDEIKELNLSNLLFYKPQDESESLIYSVVKYDDEEERVKYENIPQYALVKSKMESIISDEDSPIEYCKKFLGIVISANKFPKGSNENKLFEKLNSTGMDLSTSDLLRNFLLMKLKDEKPDEGDRRDEEERIDVWFSKTLPEEIKKNAYPYNKSEGRFFKTFVSYYANLKIDEQKDKRLYGKIKTEFDNSGDDVTNFLDELNNFLIFSKKINILQTLKRDDTVVSSTANLLSSLYRINSIYLIPLFYLIEKKTKKDILHNDDIKYQNFIEQISFKNSILYLSSNSGRLDKSMQQVNKNSKIEEIYKIKDSKFEVTIDEFSNFQEYLTLKINFLDTEEENSKKFFKEHFKIAMLYINNVIKNEINPKISLKNVKSYSIEHIIPKKWQENTSLKKYLDKIKDEIEPLINTPSNFLVLEKDACGNEWLDTKLKNYENESSFLSNEYATIIKKFNNDWNFDEIKELNEIDDFLNSLFDLNRIILEIAKEKLFSSN